MEVKGHYDINVWYSYDGNTKTEVARETIKYGDLVNINRLIRDYLYEGDEVIARTIQQPTCIDARIEGDNIIVEVEFEIVVEVIGETKMRVAILGPVEYDSQYDDEDEDDDLSEIDMQINTKFLNNSPFGD